MVLIPAESDSGDTSGDTRDAAPRKIAILHRPNKPDATYFSDRHWEIDQPDVPENRLLCEMLNSDYGPEARGGTTSLPYDLGNAEQAADDLGGTLEVLIEIRPLPDGAIP